MKHGPSPTASSQAGPDASTPSDLTGIFRALAPQVARWAARLGGPSVDVDDAVQEVFVVAHRRFARLEGFALDAWQLRVWLYRTTARVVRTRRRNERIRRFLAGTPRDFARDVPTDARSPLESLESRETARLVTQVLDDIPEKYRNVLVLFELEGHSGEEIAELTGTRLSTVWVHLHRARARFLERYAEARERAAGSRSPVHE